VEACSERLPCAEHAGTPWSEARCDMSCRYLLIISADVTAARVPPEIDPKKLAVEISWGKQKTLNLLQYASCSGIHCAYPVNSRLLSKPLITA